MPEKPVSADDASVGLGVLLLGLAAIGLCRAIFGSSEPEPRQAASAAPVTVTPGAVPPQPCVQPSEPPPPAEPLEATKYYYEMAVCPTCGGSNLCGCGNCIDCVGGGGTTSYCAQCA